MGTCAMSKICPNHALVKMDLRQMMLFTSITPMSSVIMYFQIYQQANDQHYAARRTHHFW